MIHSFTTSNPSFWRLIAPALAALALSAGDADAQRRPVPVEQTGQAGESRREPSVPPGYSPPAGMCRIWIKGVPPGQQPAPTDCSSAVRNRPANGKVLFGDEPGKTKKGKSNKKSTSSNVVDLIKRGMSR